ncbi:right-handed parallel beta-helix repeat-containing protein [Thermococcus sp. ES12]|uniref:right-handed parallel beta-helix repeat-containing protein n=1 Tax=Thermococcus sp. ES12 TaxID=1638246 RepID=UPI0014303414|nr:right-handed parallel beta-helix repeat-containing protein [Thermococcus sp. ES12]NJE76890.1 PGF-pre-PGF domain-containing protein [Thermococcus sp. ES12]
MRKLTVFLIYLLLASYLNVGFVGVSHVVQAQGTYVFQDDFNDNSLDPARWSTEVVGDGNSVTETSGEIQVVTYGHGGWDSGHALLKSREIDVDNWSSVTFEADWKFTDPNTAEMLVHVVDLDTGKYVGVHYISWNGPKVSYRYDGTSQDEPREIPTNYVPFKIVIYRDRFEFWESGILVKTISTTSMSGTTRFQFVLGGWESSPLYSHMYFDNAAVEYEPALPEDEPLEVTIVSPEEREYDTSVIDLNVTANKPVDEWRYSLNGGENVTFTPNTTITAPNGENRLVVYALAGDERGMAQVNFYVNAEEEDTTPPGTVRNLTHEVGADYIHWTWDNPEDEDFETALVYIDGEFQGETDEGEWWLDELSPGETHTIGILTRDYSGNVNTTWVNDTATTLTPAETVYVNESGWWYEGGELNPSETPLQDGIDGAVKGGTVIVLAGTYPESVEVDKPLTVETGENARITGDGSEWENGKKPVFYVSSDNVTLRGFEIDSSVSNIGVWLDDVGNCTVENNNIIIREAGESERYGIYLSYGGNHVVRNNEVSVSGFQGVGIYVYETDGESDVYGNTVVTEGDSADGIEVFYSSAWVYDNTISISGVGETPGYALYLYLAEDSSIDNNGLTTNLSEENAWAILVIGEFKGSLSGNRINGVQTEIVCPENCLLRGVSPENRPAPPEGYGDVGEYLEIDADSWLHLGLYYDDSSLGGLREDTLQIWRFNEGWTLDGTSGGSLDTSKNLVEANLTQFSIFAPLAQEENDVTPPVLTFVEPTPENGALIGYSHVVINVTSNENLSGAIIEFDGANHTMLGSGRSWYYEADVLDGIHTFKAYGTDLAGNNGTSEGRSFEVDTKAPEYSDVGQDKAGIPPGGELHVHAFWSDPHLSYARLVTNATEGGAWDWIDDTFFEGSEGWSNFTISTEGLDPGLYCWFIEASDSLEHWNSTPTECFRLYEPPEIVSHSPESPVESYVGDTVTFSITASQIVNVTWYLDGNPVKTEQNVETSTYTNSDAGEGEHGVRAAVENANGSASQFWAWYVYPRPGLTVSFVGPTPENGARLNVRTVVINVTSSLDLESATLEWNGVNESMSGSGRSWWATKEDLADGTYTFRVYGSADGVSNATEERTIEIDATAPGFIEYGQSSDEVLEGESIEVFARWSDAHLDGAVLVTNATFVDGAFVWSEVPLEIAGGWSNWSINTDGNFAGKVFCWYIRANDTFGNENETPELCFRVGERLRIISFSPESSEVELPHNGTAVFSVELNQIANVTWFVNGTEVFEEVGNESTYTNSTLIPGLWNVSVIAGNGNGLARHWWLMHVNPPENEPPEIQFVPPTPENGSLLGSGWLSFAINSSENLSSAVLELDGLNHTMSGSGKSWEFGPVLVDDGPHTFRAYGTDEGGATGASEPRTVVTDSTDPEVVDELVNLTVVSGTEDQVWVVAERLSKAGVWITARDPHPGWYTVDFNPDANTPQAGWYRLGAGEWESEVPFFIPFNTSEEGYVIYFISVADALNHLGYDRYFFLTVRDTTPPKKIAYLQIYPFVGGAEIAWQNPSDEDFNHTELWINETLVGNFTGEPGSIGGYTAFLTTGETYNISVVPVDRYGNRGEATWKSVKIPYPSLNVRYVPPTPADGAELPSDTDRITVKVSSEDEISACRIVWDGASYSVPVEYHWVSQVDERGNIHSKLVYTCEKTFSGHLNGGHSFYAVVSDGYGHFKALQTRHVEVLWPCFEDCALELRSPEGNVMSLFIPINFTMTGNSLPANYSLTIENLRYTEEFSPNVSYTWEGERLSLTGSFVLDMRPFMKDMEKLGGEPVILKVTAKGPCGNEVSAETGFTVCKGNERPELKVELPDSVRPGEAVVPVIEAKDPNGNLEGIYISINGNSYMEYSPGMDVSEYLQPYANNIVKVKAVDLCGEAVIQVFKVKVEGPPLTGDWVVDNVQTCNGRDYTVNGSLLITGSGSLELRNCRVHLLGSEVEVNGTLRALQGSLIYGTSLGLYGEGGTVEVSESGMKGFDGGNFTGTASFLHSSLTGELVFNLSTVELDGSEVVGEITASGSLSVRGSSFHDGKGLTYLRPLWNSSGSLIIANSTFRNNDFGIKFVGVASDWYWKMENLLVENNRECGLYLEAPRYGYAIEELKNVTVRNNGKGVCAKKIRLGFRDSLIESNGERNFELELGSNWIYLYDTNVTGSDYAFHAINAGGIELHDVNVTGDVSPYLTYLMVYVDKGKESTFEGGKGGRFFAFVDGKLRLRSYTIEGGKIQVKPDGTLRVEDVDGIPATSDLDRDASVLRNMTVEGLRNGSAQSHMVIMNSRLEDSTFGTLSTDVLLRGCRIDGGSVSFSTPMFWSEEDTEVGGTVIGENAEWFYSTSEPGENWMYVPESTGMSSGTAPFSADMYRSHFTSGTEVGEFTDLYLKKVVSFEKLPVLAWLDYYAISGVEIYVNGRKVVDELDHEAQLSFVQGWGGGSISAHPLMGLVDIAGYLRTGDNVIAVHVRSPNRYPYLQLGAFRGTLYTVGGAAGLRDSVVNAPVHGSSARLILAGDEINGNVTSEYYSRVRIIGSTVHGSVEASGYLKMERSEITGDGTCYGVWSDGRFDIIINGSTVSGFEYGVHLLPLGSKGSVEIVSSTITGNEVGLWIRQARADIRSNYVMHNGRGMDLSEVNGTVYNSLLFDNGEGIVLGTWKGTNLLLDHDTVTGGSVGISVTGGNGGRVSLTNSIVQNNGLGLLVDGNAILALENNSLVNGKGIHLTKKAGSLSINNTDWGGHEPKFVKNYTGGTMYTASGEEEENYDILSETGNISPGSTVGTGPGWGSSLLGVSLNLYPMENDTVRGVVSLAGRATSRSPITKVNYTLIYNGTEEILGESTPNSGEYYDYITLDTLGRNLTGTGYLKFTAKNAEGTSISAVRKVRFGNADIRIEGFSISHPTAVYVYRRDPDYYGTSIPYDERFANVSVLLKNIGGLTGVAKIELVLPEYIERHTGRVNLLVAVPGNTTGYFNALIPITVFDPITLTWDPLPDELPGDGKIPLKIRLYDTDGILRDERNATIEFDLGPVFKINEYDAYVYTRQWCQGSGECHVKNYGLNSYTYDGDGDENLEAAESHHFDITFQNIGDRPAYLRSFSVRDYIPERDPNLHNKLLKRNSVTLLGGGDATFMADVWSKNLTRLVKPGEKRWVHGAWMPWWLDAPPRFIPPVNFSGEYLSSMNVIYNETVNGQPRQGYYVTIPVNYVKTPVEALDKSFIPFTENVGPVQVDVIGVNGNKTYLKLTNTNDNVYYSYYAEGDYDMNPEGYVWYHVIPPGFEFKAIADHSKEPGTVIPHYRVTVGVEYSLLFNEIDLIAIGVEGGLGVYDIDVPARTIAMAIAKSMLKITNIVENIDFPDEDKNFTWMAQNSPETNDLIAADDATYAAILDLNTMARLEQNYGMDRQFYEEVANFGDIPLPRELEVVKKYGKAILGDEDLQILFLETVLEIIDNDDLNEIYKEAQDAANPKSPEEEMAEDFSETSKKIAKEKAQELVVKEIKKKKSFQSLSPEKQKKALKDAKGSIAAAVDTFITLGEWAFYNIYATLTQPLPVSIQVLDPPANYTVEAQRLDTAILLGGEGGSLDGWGNVSLNFGETDIYRAEYIVPTPLTRVGSLFNGTLEEMSVEITGSRKGEMRGSLRMEIKPDPRNASMVFALFRNGAFTEAFLGSYFTSIDSFDVRIRNDTIILSAEGRLVALPEDEEIHVTMSVGRLFTNATIERRGHYRGTVELKPAFGIEPSNVETSIGGDVETSRGDANGSVVIAVPENGTVEPPEINVAPQRLYIGGTVGIETSKPCPLAWRLGSLSGEGAFVPTEKLEPGNHTLTVICTYGNLSVEKAFTIELLKRPEVRNEADGNLVSADSGDWVAVSTKTDLYRLYFLPRVKVSGVVAVYQRAGEVEAQEGYDYITYAVFNVTHPENWSIANATLRFRVSKEWMVRHNVSRTSLLLLHYENGWKEYKPTFEYEDLRYAYYKVSVPSLSLFAVAEKVKVENETSGETETPTHTESPTETTPARAPEGGNTTYYVLAALVILALIAYAYRRR